MHNKIGLLVARSVEQEGHVELNPCYGLINEADYSEPGGTRLAGSRPIFLPLGQEITRNLK